MSIALAHLPTTLPVMRGVHIPLWGFPILLVLLGALSLAGKRRDRNR